MGKRRNISPTRRSQILPLHFDKWSNREIAKVLQCSISACQHAVHNCEHLEAIKIKIGLADPKNQPQKDRIIHRITSTDLKA